MGVVPSLPSFNMLIGALVRAGNSSTAEALLQRMGSLGLQPDTVTFASLMDPARSAPPSQAVSWLQSMQQAGVEPDTLCYNKVIASYARAR